MPSFGINTLTACIPLEGSSKKSMTIIDEHTSMHGDLATSGSIFNTDKTAMLFRFTHIHVTTPNNSFCAYMRIDDVVDAFNLKEPFNFKAASKTLRQGTSPWSLSTIGGTNKRNP
jgi:hypothetical protein